MKVRIHAYAGLKQLYQNHGTQFASDSVKMLQEPYIWGITLDSNGAVPVELPPDSTPNVKVIRVEVEAAQAIRYEINTTPGSASERTAGANSPYLSGIDVFDFHPGWGFQFVDAASV
jgi:hypothetical protein